MILVVDDERNHADGVVESLEKSCEKAIAVYSGTDAMEIHEDAIAPGTRVLMIDDLLATGGTMAACCDLVSGLKGEIVGAAFLIELCFLNGREKLGDYPLHSVIKFEG